MSDPRRDSEALEHRLQTHARFGRYEINDWILGITRPAPGERVLDVGCGTGKQLLAAAERIGPGGAAVGVDVSAESLRAVEARVSREGHAGRVRLVEAAMEDLDAALPEDERYDLALSCFALYYAKAPGEALDALRRRLADGGRLFVCGPGRGNNRELMALCDAVVPRSAQTRRLDDTLCFMDETAPELFAARFASVQTHRFENPVAFPDAESVLTYWRSYHLYAPDYEAAFRDAVARYLAAHGEFVTVKRVSGALLS